MGLLIKVLRADARACGHNKYHIIIVSTAYQQVLWYTVAERIPSATRYWSPVDSERSGAVGKTRSEINVLPERIRICICTYGMGCPSTAPRLVPM